MSNTTPYPEVAEFAQQAAAAGVQVADVLKRAGVAHTTWGRWQRGRFEPRPATLRQLRRVLAEMSGDAA